ncbi:MAG TPA: helix-turn-helix domain-containing protein [Candidatus Nanoarchaeia archaeon]|nr:helix-turn-helix domain-containing protein [Candidatus Nanoarchaeia archaeon]
MIQLSDKLISELLSFGLTGNEAKVFLALIQLRKANAHEIAKEADIPRQEVYRVLPNLEKLGIIQVIIDKPTKYVAVDPKKALAHLIQMQQEKFETQIHELSEKKVATASALSAVEGKSSGWTRQDPIRFMLISGQNLINEKIEEMLRNAKKEVLWMAPKSEVKRAFAFGREKLLRDLVKKNSTVRIITEIDGNNVEEVERLNRFCEIKHSDGVSSVATIVDDKELIIGSAIYSAESAVNTEMMHELWTNDSGHINLMKDFFEKVWNVSVPAIIGIQAVRSGKRAETFSIIHGKENVESKLREAGRLARLKLFMVSYVTNESAGFAKSLFEETRKEETRTRWVTTIDPQNKETVKCLAASVEVHVLKERPVSFLLTDSECIFSSTPILQIPNEVIWTSDQNIVNMFWALAEEIWNKLSGEIVK